MNFTINEGREYWRPYEDGYGWITKSVEDIVSDIECYDARMDKLKAMYSAFYTFNIQWDCEDGVNKWRFLK